MEEKLSSVAKTLAPSPIQQLSYLAQRCNAINLAEGFPDFPAPAHIKNAAVSAINSDFNQYRLFKIRDIIPILLLIFLVLDSLLIEFINPYNKGMCKGFVTA